MRTSKAKMRKNTHSCKEMKKRLSYQCEDHSDPFDCPDSLIIYVPRFDEYGLIVHDGGQSYITISFCPWCGKKLPVSKRDRWFETLAAHGYDNPSTQEIPKEFLSNEWYLKPARKS